MDMLKNPIYTGAYVYGRRETRRGLVDGRPRTRIIPLPREQWRVFLPDHHPAYVTWEEYLANQDKISANRSTRATPGEHRVALGGSGLLQGIVLCGRCGGRMHTEYVSGTARARYLCRNPIMHGLSASLCWSLAAAPVDDEVQRQFLESAQPPELELCLAVATEATRQGEAIDRQWALRLERAQYEARLAERRYKAVDPDNRVVARTLETDWEARLRDLAEVEQQRDAAKQRQRLVLDDDDRQRILQLARDLPRVWHAASTTWQQRKNLLRILVQEVVLTPVDLPSRQTRVQILWDGGATTEAVVERPRGRSGSQNPPAAEQRIRELVEQGAYDVEIAQSLNDSGLRTGRGRAWDRAAVFRARDRLGLRRPMATPSQQKVPDQRADGLYSIRGVAKRFDVAVSTVRSWLHRGVLAPTEGGGRGYPAWFLLDAETIGRIEAQQRGHQSTTPGDAS
jgi:hypothetical protein